VPWVNGLVEAFSVKEIVAAYRVVTALRSRLEGNDDVEA
jgi:hypothetical protein